jgi:hypothetical protein
MEEGVTGVGGVDESTLQITGGLSSAMRIADQRYIRFRDSSQYRKLQTLKKGKQNKTKRRSISPPSNQSIAHQFAAG